MAKHALLSASGAHRWLLCTPSAQLEQKFPASTSAYAEEGTVAHALAELTTRYFLGELDEVTYFTAEIVDQVWAEIVMRYSAGENWYLDNAKIEAVARQIQDAHTEMNGKQGLLEQFVERLLPKDWATRNLSQRLAYWNDGFDDEKQAGTERRKTICALEIHCELFGGTVKDYTPQKTREYNAMLKRLPGWKARSRINYGEIYGQQRGFVREETE